jgi:hypothetical protein
LFLQTEAVRNGFERRLRQQTEATTTSELRKAADETPMTPNTSYDDSLVSDEHHCDQGYQIFLYQMTLKHNKWSQNIPTDPTVHRTAIKYTNFFHCKTLQNLPNLGFLVWKYAIWQLDCDRNIM